MDNRTNLGVPLLILLGVAIGGYLLIARNQLFQVISTRKKKVRVRRKGEGSIHVISSIVEWEKVYPLLVKDTQEVKVVGLDCEWVSEEYVRHPVALLQLSTQQGLCVLIRLCHMTNRLPQSLRTFLADKSIYKVGVSVKDDGKKLYRDYGLPVNGCVDLRFVLPCVPNVYKCKTRGLQGLAEGVLGVEMSKEEGVRCGNWEADTLTQQQIDYGAADAMVGVDIFTKLVLTMIIKQDSDTVYPPGQESVDIDTFRRAAEGLCLGVVDRPYISSRAPRSEGQRQNFKAVEQAEGGSRVYSPRQKPLNFNCQLQSPSGKLICRCDNLRAEWYLKKNLGRKISEDPYIVELCFEHSETELDEDFDELYDKHSDAVTMCVVCGRTDAFVRKVVIPTEYRRFFHRVMKSSRRSHNVLILCPDCHFVSSQHDAIMRQKLAEKCDAPLDSGAGSKTVNDRDLKKIQAAAKALKLNREKIPAGRVQDLEKVLMDFYEVESVEEELLDMALNMDTKVHNTSYVPHGKLVVEHYRKHENLYEFEKMWRKHFLDTMQPKYLPPFWEVDFRNIKVDGKSPGASATAHSS